MDLNLAKRKARLERIKIIANFIALNYLNGNQTDLIKITVTEEIPVLYDHYENCFDGLLSFENNNFYIHLNIDLGNNPNSRRSRFSLSHELGHYFIPEHHESIINGNFRCPPSIFKINHDDLIEEEADCFAAHLLMPSDIFKKLCFRKKFSLDLVNYLAELFNVSMLSTLLRFADKDAGTSPIMISFFRNHLLSGYKQSEDFPLNKVPFKTKIGNPPPPTSVIGEYYLKTQSKFKDVQEVSIGDWFCLNSTKRLYEQCFYSDYGFDISVLWFD
jgi:Zn-dependent peptidase ImmA (M78 family)